jgi:hypothetical protein
MDSEVGRCIVRHEQCIGTDRIWRLSTCPQLRLVKVELTTRRHLAGYETDRGWAFTRRRVEFGVNAPHAARESHG